MKALFCTDGSEISFSALDNIADYCKGLEIDILCVIDWNFYPMYMSYPEKDFINTYDELASKVLNHAVEYINQKGQIAGETKKVWGNASEEIIKHTKNNHYDLIILGSHGKKGIKSWLGSVSRQIVNNSHDPVFVSKEKKENKKILFTADGSLGSKYAIKQALKLLNFEQKDIYTITVMDDVSTLPIEVTSNKEWFNDYLQKRNCFSQNVMRETSGIFKEHNLEIKEQFSLIGSPSTVIIDTIEKQGIDLVILGSRSKDKVSEFLLGSTSKRVLEKVKSSVLIVSPPHEE